MRKIYKLATGYAFTSKREDNLSHALKNSLARAKIDICDYLEFHYNISIKPCAFCGTRTKRFNIDFKIDGSLATITGVNFNTAAISGDKFYCYGENRACEGKKFNPNSITFVSRTNGISEDEANDLILERNQTPFYSKNHENYDDYRIFQARTKSWFDTRGMDIKESIKKGNFSRSLDGMISRYGREKGTDIWNEICDRKRNTLEEFKRRYGDEIGELKYKQKNKKCSVSLENFIRKYGDTKGHLAFMSAISANKIVKLDDFIKFCVSIVSKEPLRVCKGFPVVEILLRSRSVQVGMDVFNLTTDDLLRLCVERDPNIHSKETFLFGGKYRSYHSYTLDGQLLRSSGEMLFYEAIQTSHPEWEIRVGKTYPDSNMKYDFYFPEIDTYIEIAGMMNIESYRIKIAAKKEKYDCIIISDITEIDNTIKTIEERYDRIR